MRNILENDWKSINFFMNIPALGDVLLTPVVRHLILCSNTSSGNYIIHSVLSHLSFIFEERSSTFVQMHLYVEVGGYHGIKSLKEPDQSVS